MAKQQYDFMAKPVTPKGEEREMIVILAEGRTQTVLSGSYTSYRNFIKYMLNVHGVQTAGYNVYRRDRGDMWTLMATQVVPR